MKKIGTVCLFVLFAILSPGQETTIRQLYQTILAHSAGKEVPEAKDIFGKVNEAMVRALPEAEIDAILPLAFQCIQSPNAEVRQAGDAFLISTMLRFDSAKILEPYIDELGKLSDKDQDGQARGYILAVLGGLIPKLPDKTIAYLEANLESSRNTSLETVSITASLLKASRGSLLHPVPADPSVVHKVIAFTAAQADPDLTSNVLHELGLYGIQTPEAINFISANLNESNPRLRAAAVEGASRLDNDSRAQLRGQLSQIASDPKEDQDVRKHAAQALKP